MASTQRPSTMEKLPCEVLFDIFILLLAKQLAQMRCVCKSWNALLSESSFIKSHLHRSIHNNDGILMFIPSDHNSSIIAHPDLKLTKVIKLPVDPQFENSIRIVIGSVNGLICFYYGSFSLPSRDSVVYIWNPSLSAVLTLPPCSLPYDDSMNIHFRFGFDPKTEDYKVVKLTSLLEPPNMLPQVEVYSMRKGSWELITQRFPSNITMIRDDDNVCVDGHDGRLHWLGFADLDWKPTILAFDLGAETFYEMPLSDSIPEYRFKVLRVLSGKLCVISRVEVGECEVWVMDEYGVVESWVKKHHVISQFSNKFPYGFTSHGEFLFQVEGDRFALYDPVADKAKTFKIMPSLYIINKFVEYVDSLVWVAPVVSKVNLQPSKGLQVQKATTHQHHYFYLLLLLCMMLCFLLSYLYKKTSGMDSIFRVFSALGHI